MNQVRPLRRFPYAVEPGFFLFRQKTKIDLVLLPHLAEDIDFILILIFYSSK